MIRVRDFLFPLATVVVALAFAVGVPAFAQPLAEDPERPLAIEGVEGNDALRDSLEREALDARAALREAANLPLWPGPERLVWVQGAEAFKDETGFRGEHIAAAASASRRTIWINAGNWTRNDLARNRQVMRHEMAHLLVGTLPGGGDLPLWFEEGLVQHLAGQIGIEDHVSLATGRVFGGVPELRDLTETFPRDPRRQELSYALSHRAVGAVADDLADGSITRLLSMLASDRDGPTLSETVWSPLRRDEWNAVANDLVGSKVESAAIVFSTGTVFWVFIAILVVIAFFVLRRRRARATLVRAQNARPDPWDDEGEWTESLSDEDVQDVWGDRNDRWGEVEETPWERHLRERGED